MTIDAPLERLKPKLPKKPENIWPSQSMVTSFVTLKIAPAPPLQWVKSNGPSKTMSVSIVMGRLAQVIVLTVKESDRSMKKEESRNDAANGEVFMMMRFF